MGKRLLSNRFQKLGTPDFRSIWHAQDGLLTYVVAAVVIRPTSRDLRSPTRKLE